MTHRFYNPYNQDMVVRAQQRAFRSSIAAGTHRWIVARIGGPDVYHRVNHDHWYRVKQARKHEAASQ